MRNNRDCTLSPLGNVLLPISKTLSREGVLRDPGLFGVPGFEVLAESRLENMSASRLRECLNCDSESRLHAQENSEMSLGWDADMYIYNYLSCEYSNIEKRRARGRKEYRGAFGTEKEIYECAKQIWEAKSQYWREEGVWQRSKGCTQPMRVDRQVFSGLVYFNKRCFRVAHG